MTLRGEKCSGQLGSNQQPLPHGRALASFDAVCALWDDPVLYHAVATRARGFAQQRYSEEVSRKRLVDYFTSLRPGGRPVWEHPPGGGVAPKSRIRLQ